MKKTILVADLIIKKKKHKNSDDVDKKKALKQPFENIIAK